MAHLLAFIEFFFLIFIIYASIYIIVFICSCNYVGVYYVSSDLRGLLLLVVDVARRVCIGAPISHQ